MKKLIAMILIIASALCCLTACGGNPDGDGEDGTENAKILIAYFSCTNNTEAVAKYVKDETKGVLYEIVPEVPYTADDLKYYTDCRADREQADSTARPAISGSVENMEKYDVIFLGYPIWHGEAPKIIYTFLESYDFKGKTIVPFCTSASSGIGSSDTHLHSLAQGAEWISGKRFAEKTSRSTVADWIKSLDLKLPTDNREITTMFITVNGNKLEVALENNSAAKALAEKLKQGDVTYTANDYGDFEKVGGLGFDLPADHKTVTTQAGDVVLYLNNQIVLFYGSNKWSYTKLGKIAGYTAAELRTLLGAGNGEVEVTLSLQ